MGRTPEKLRYASSHEWVDMEGDIATVGISAFAVAELTDLVYMALPEVGKSIKAGEEFGEVESVKAVSSLYAPVGGTITAVNAQLVDQLEMLGSDPYEQGWLIKLQVSDPSEVQALMDFESYQKQCGNA